jgi:hypothetical protein
MISPEEDQRLRGKSLAQYHCVHHKSRMNYLDAKLGLRGEKPATNRQSYDTVT